MMSLAGSQQAKVVGFQLHVCLSNPSDDGDGALLNSYMLLTRSLRLERENGSKKGSGEKNSGAFHPCVRERERSLAKERKKGRRAMRRKEGKRDDVTAATARRGENR